MEPMGIKTGLILIECCGQQSVNIPVIASGGGGTLDHFADALTVGRRMRFWRLPFFITELIPFQK
ncbi:MAG: hypothetical protein Ct9H90mP9_6020 [Pseudomonadota bacterium]|nr:MAG: hypothetical protein Ct9H90mP9_6020 [Pseudomonadota bacterium]